MDLLEQLEQFYLQHLNFHLVNISGRIWNSWVEIYVLKFTDMHKFNTYCGYSTKGLSKFVFVEHN